MFSEETLPSDTSDSEATTSLKEMRRNSPKDSTNKDQLQFHSKSLLDSRTMLEEFTLLTTVERELKMSIMLFWPLAMETRAEKTSGTLRTHGDLHGV